MTAAGRFRVRAGTVGSVEETDGIALDLRSFGPAYPRGLLVVQDGSNSPHAQNFSSSPGRVSNKPLAVPPALTHLRLHPGFAPGRGVHG